MDLTKSNEDKEKKKGHSYFKVYFGAFSACMGSTCIGTALTYTSPALPMLLTNATGDITLTESQGSWFSSVLALAALAGSIGAGILARNLGRRMTMLLAALSFIASWVLIAFAQNTTMLILSRVVSGLGTGVSCAVIPTYVGEISPVEIRGTAGSIFQLMMGFGTVYSYIFGSFVDSWRILSAICIIPAAIFFVLVFISKESPVYFLSIGKDEKAAESLRYFRGGSYDTTEELLSMKKDLMEGQEGKASLIDFRSPHLLKPLFISLTVMFFQQASGICAVLFNLTSIFQAAETGISDEINVILVGLIQIPVMLLSTILMDRAGRKPLLIISSLFMAISSVCLGVFFYLQDHGSVESIRWLPLVSFVVYIVAFDIGCGPIPWLLMNELFPRDYSVIAGSMVTMLNWSMVFLTTLSFAPLKGAINDSGVFWLYGAICVVSIAFNIVVVPETKGKTLQEISKFFKGKEADEGHDATTKTVTCE